MFLGREVMKFGASRSAEGLSDWALHEITDSFSDPSPVPPHRFSVHPQFLHL